MNPINDTQFKALLARARSAAEVHELVHREFARVTSTAAGLIACLQAADARLIALGADEEGTQGFRHAQFSEIRETAAGSAKNFKHAMKEAA